MDMFVLSLAKRTFAYNVRSSVLENSKKCVVLGNLRCLENFIDTAVSQIFLVNFRSTCGQPTRNSDITLRLL